MQLQAQRSTRHTLRWAGGARAATHGKTSLYLCPHSSAHTSPGSSGAFSSPAWMRGWPEAQQGALLRSLLGPWCSELPAGSACGGSNRSGPGCCPRLTRRSPAQPQGAHTAQSPQCSTPRGFPPGKAEPLTLWKNTVSRRLMMEASWCSCGRRTATVSDSGAALGQGKGLF